MMELIEKIVNICIQKPWTGVFLYIHVCYCKCNDWIFRSGEAG